MADHKPAAAHAHKSEKKEGAWAWLKRKVKEKAFTCLMYIVSILAIGSVIYYWLWPKAYQYWTTVDVLFLPTEDLLDRTLGVIFTLIIFGVPAIIVLFFLGFMWLLWTHKPEKAH